MVKQKYGQQVVIFQSSIDQIELTEINGKPKTEVWPKKCNQPCRQT